MVTKFPYKLGSYVARFSPLFCESLKKNDRQGLQLVIMTYLVPGMKNKKKSSSKEFYVVVGWCNASFIKKLAYTAVRRTSYRYMIRRTTNNTDEGEYYCWWYLYILRSIYSGVYIIYRILLIFALPPRTSYVQQITRYSVLVGVMWSISSRL